MKQWYSTIVIRNHAIFFIFQTTLTYFEGGYRQCFVYLLEKLQSGHLIAGPAVIIDQLSTHIIEPDCEAEVTAQGDLRIRILTVSTPDRVIGTQLDPVQLSIFSHRFMSIAEQMGRILQRTSVSTNVQYPFLPQVQLLPDAIHLVLFTFNFTRYICCLLKSNIFLRVISVRWDRKNYFSS